MIKFSYFSGHLLCKAEPIQKMTLKIVFDEQSPNLE
jgi:hypothetical protein